MTARVARLSAYACRCRSASGTQRPAPVLELVPIAPLAGNIGLSIVALSYAGRLAITVQADAAQFPDLDVLVSAMGRDGRALARRVRTPTGAALTRVAA